MKSLRTRAAAVGLAIAAASGGCQEPTRSSLGDGLRVLDRVEAILDTVPAESLGRLGHRPFAYPSIEFCRPGPEANGATEFLGMQPDPADPENGADDDGDGLVDEARLVWIDGAGAAEVVCENVLPVGAGEELNGMDDNGNGLIDEAGVFFHGHSEQVTIGISIQDPTGTPRILTRVVTPAQN